MKNTIKNFCNFFYNKKNWLLLLIIIAPANIIKGIQINQPLKSFSFHNLSRVTQNVNNNSSKNMNVINIKRDYNNKNYKSESRIQSYFFDEERIYSLKLKPGFQSHILFEKGEEVKTISVGENHAFKFNIIDNRLFIRPLEENIKTNMTVITNKRSYEFDLVVIKGSSNENCMYILKFDYLKRIKNT